MKIFVIACLLVGLAYASNVDQIVDEVFQGTEIHDFDMETDLPKVRAYLEYLADATRGAKQRKELWKWLPYNDQFALKAAKFIHKSLSGRHYAINNQIRAMIGLAPI